MNSLASKAVIGSLCVALALAACGKKAAGPAAAGTSKTLQIAVIPKGTTHEFWKSIHAGAVRAAGELGVEIFWKGPQKEDDRAQQITVVEDFISRGVDGIVLAPLDDRALVRPVQDAVRDKIPVVIIDSGLQGSDYISYVATDNYKGGVLAARRLGELLKGKGRIFLIRYQEGSASTVQREAGFADTMAKEFPGITFLVKDQYAGATTETAYQLAENLLSRFPDVEGVFTPKLVQGLRDGDLQGLVIQNPDRMGYLGVKTMVAFLRGQPVEKVIDTGVVLATKDNMDSPEIKALLTPDLSMIND
jgi:ribose transport system substrate-binding protein